MSLEIIEPQGYEPENDVIERYRLARPRYDDFTHEIRSMIEKLTAEHKSAIVSLECRAKTVNSLAEKLARDPGKYSDALNDVTDLSGCRIITYYSEDIDIIDEIVRKNFQVDERNSERKDLIDNPKEFGYLSRHLVISMGSDLTKHDLFKRFKGMKCEVQIRTVLQHAWASIEHKLQYKNKHDIPHELRRKLFRISAMLEVADDQFSVVRKSIGNLRETYRDEFTRGRTEVPLNVESLDVYLKSSERLNEIRNGLAATEISCAPTPPTAQNPLGKLTETLRAAKIDSIAKLDELIAKHTAEEWTAEFVDIVAKWREGFPTRRTPYGQFTRGPSKLVLDDPVIVRIMVLKSGSASLRKKIVREVPFGGRLQTALLDWLDDAIKET